MLQTEAREGQTLLLCQRDAALKAALLVWPSRDLHLYSPLGWRIGTSERRSTSGQCWSLDINDLDVDGRLGSRGKLRHSKVCLHALALQAAIGPLAELEPTPCLEGRPGPLHSPVELPFGLHWHTHVPLQGC